ncbi:dnaJ homolog subfamily C member 30, mitochondrial [Sphaerodactylus townsendi]|uniref:Uncharacterized protein n=1 Tax=Sphaerodactylus townsendi TaxID=933632 RepID=A0ACB8EDJ1_9SAUR|nr:dnaJ homolog subfamily C member 30, mitochondrial [Sphaerodactylus townsendi]
MAVARADLVAPPLLPWALRGLAVRGFSQAGGTRHDSPSGLYELLGVAANATQAQIKTAYYKQSFLYHPDRNSGSEEAAERFTRINEAYLVLGSVALRKKYDRGILSLQDLRMAGKPSGKEAAASPPSRRTQNFTATPSSHYGRSKPIFDFDKFYREHYGEQLERERLIRERQQEMKKRKEKDKSWDSDTLKEMMAVLVFISAFVLLVNRR